MSHDIASSRGLTHTHNSREYASAERTQKQQVLFINLNFSFGKIPVSSARAYIMLQNIFSISIEIVCPFWIKKQIANVLSPPSPSSVWIFNINLVFQQRMSTDCDEAKRKNCRWTQVNLERSIVPSSFSQMNVERRSPRIQQSHRIQ